MADSDLQIREGGGHPDPKMKEGRSQKLFFGHAGLSLV